MSRSWSNPARARMAGHMEVTFEQKALGMVIGCRERDKRAVVVTIRKGGAAESLGVLPGMLIASVDGSAMTSFDEARAPRPVEERPGAAARAFRFWISTVAPQVIGRVPRMQRPLRVAFEVPSPPASPASSPASASGRESPASSASSRSSTEAVAPDGPLLVRPAEPDYASFLNWNYHADATLTFPQTLVLRYRDFARRRRPPALFRDDHDRDVGAAQEPRRRGGRLRQVVPRAPAPAGRGARGPPRLPLRGPVHGRGRERRLRALPRPRDRPRGRLRAPDRGLPRPPRRPARVPGRAGRGGGVARGVA